MVVVLLAAFGADAEAVRLTEEIDQHARSNQWAGVERVYRTLLTEHPASIGERSHVLAAEAARSRGELVLAAQRLARVSADSPESEGAKATYGIITDGLRLVRLRGKADASLVAEVTPFTPERIQLIQNADGALHEVGYFAGLLPVGAYEYGTLEVDIPAGQGWLTLDLSALSEREADAEADGGQTRERE